MSGWLYLIRNRDLYKIGITRNFESRMRQLKPDNIVTKLYTSDFIKLERELHYRYKEFRIPQTEYFRLENFHVKEIKTLLYYLDYPIITNFIIFTKSLLLLLSLFLLVYTSIYLTINDLNIVFIKSVLWTERFLFCYSFLSIFLQSGKQFCFLNELKYRTTRTVCFIVFAFFLRYFFANYH